MESQKRCRQIATEGKKEIMFEVTTTRNESHKRRRQNAFVLLSKLLYQ